MKLLLSLLAFFHLQAFAQPSRDLLFVGTYSIRGSEGVYVFSFDRKSGTLSPVGTAKNAKSPSFLAVHPSGKYVYAVNENGGSVSAYALDEKAGSLSLLNEVSSQGGGPCHISVDASGKCAVISNYGGGTLAVVPIRPDGTLGEATDRIQFSGKGPNAQRQEKPHIHSATISGDNRFVYVADLGSDRLYAYELDPQQGKLTPAATPFVTVAPGSGPRHFTIHPNGRFAYLVEELTSSTAVFARDPKRGTLQLIQEGVKTLPADFIGTNNTSADIHTDLAGRYLYQSNRGRNALAIMAIGKDGKLTRVGDEPTGGRTPRNCLVDPISPFVLVANQDTDNIVVFRRNPKTGKLTPTGQQVSVPAPVCLRLHSLR